jgi:hypothetical protein
LFSIARVNVPVFLANKNRVMLLIFCRGRRPRRPAKNERLQYTKAGGETPPLQETSKSIVGATIGRLHNDQTNFCGRAMHAPTAKNLMYPVGAKRLQAISWRLAAFH